MRVLAADIGGTNARFALTEFEGHAAQVVFERIYATSDFSGFEPALERFLADLCAACGQPLSDPHGIARAAIAVAGPVDGGAGRLVNRANWQVDLGSLASRGIRGLLINDFEALAHGVLHSGPQDSMVLQEGRAAERAPIALVGAGSGLGVAQLVWDGSAHRPRPSEGGHVGFAPRDMLQLELHRDLAAQHGRVSAERVVCGAGLAAIHDFLARARGESGARLEPAEITAQGLADRSSLAGQAVDLFIACYGAFAGDVALTFLARGGVYICGGIAAKLASRMAEPDFIAAFNDKGRHSDLVASIPIRLVTNEKLGLRGAAWAARDATI
jgi:glucokinase